MRITGGTLNGRQIQLPKGPKIRPTQDQVRQSLFNLLGTHVEGAHVLDLCAGSGALGIEAASRGAARVTFVDRSRFSIQAVRANLTSLDLFSGSPSPFVMMQSDLLTAIKRLATQRPASFNLVLVDPPYERGLARKALIALGGYAILEPAALVVVEHGKQEVFPPEIQGEAALLVLQRQERYGDTALTIYQRQ